MGSDRPFFLIILRILSSGIHLIAIESQDVYIVGFKQSIFIIIQFRISIRVNLIIITQSTFECSTRRFSLLISHQLFLIWNLLGNWPVGSIFAHGNQLLVLVTESLAFYCLTLIILRDPLVLLFFNGYHLGFDTKWIIIINEFIISLAVIRVFKIIILLWTWIYLLLFILCSSTFILSPWWFWAIFLKYF